MLDLTTRQLRQLTHESDPQYTWSLVDWSPDGKTVYANRGDLMGTDSDIYAIDVVSGKTTNLTAHSGKSSHTGSSVSRNGRQVLLASNEKGGFENIALLDTASRKMTWVTDTQWEASPGEFSPDGTHFMAAEISTLATATGNPASSPCLRALMPSKVRNISRPMARA